MSWRCHDCGSLVCGHHVEPREPSAGDERQLELELTFEASARARRDASRLLEPRRMEDA